MKYLIYAIKDTKSGFLNPSFEINESIAVRNFKYAMSHEDSLFKFAPSDFELWKIGTYDTDTGYIDDCKPEYITGGKDEI